MDWIKCTDCYEDQPVHYLACPGCVYSRQLNNSKPVSRQGKQTRRAGYNSCLPASLNSWTVHLWPNVQYNNQICRIILI